MTAFSLKPERRADSGAHPGPGDRTAEAGGPARPAGRRAKLKQHGADLVGLCPFHEDREPSLVISPKKNLWHCLGACQAGGTVIDWVMRAQGVSFRHAVELLRSDHPADDAQALQQVVHYYHETLKQSPEALAYLEKRGLRSQEMIERARL